MNPKVDHAIAAVAAGQHGAIHLRQALDAGATRSQVRVRVGNGRWIGVGRHVLVLAGAPRTWRQRVMAAVLDAGPGAVASHRSAAALLGLPGFGEGAVEVTVKRGRNHRPLLGTLHETSWLPANHVTRIDGIPCSSLARCLFQLAAGEHPKRVDRAMNNAQAQLGLALEAMAEVVATIGRRGVPGTALVRRLLDERGDGYVPSESELEDLLVSVARAHGLDPPIRQLDAGGELPVGRVDFAYPHARLLLECDSRRYHTAILDWEDGVARRAGLVASGWRVIEVTWRRLVQEPERVVGEIRQALTNVR